jgi:hypothetical protein
MTVRVLEEEKTVTKEYGNRSAEREKREGRDSIDWEELLPLAQEVLSDTGGTKGTATFRRLRKSCRIREARREPTTSSRRVTATYKRIIPPHEGIR